MSDNTNTEATFVRSLDGFNGEARLYRLSESVAYDTWRDDDDPPTTDHVIVSAVVAPFTGPETYIFPANADGGIVDWGEMEGSYRGGLDHETAIEGAGWSLATA